MSTCKPTVNLRWIENNSIEISIIGLTTVESPPPIPPNFIPNIGRASMDTVAPNNIPIKPLIIRNI